MLHVVGELKMIHKGKVQAEEQIVFTSGFPPILSSQLLYFQSPELLRRTRIPAPALPSHKSGVLGHASLLIHEKYLCE